MTSTETYIAFAAIMLVIALLAVAIDWFGKPLRHRAFIPKMYRFPDERIPRSAQGSPAVPDPRTDQPAIAMAWADEGPPPSAPRAFAGPPSTHPDPEVPTRSWASPYPDEPARRGRWAADPDLDRFEDLADDGVPLSAGGDSAVGFETDETPHTDLDDAGADGDTEHDVEVEPFANETRDQRGVGWTLGHNIYNLTTDGEEPPPSIVRSRYWQNLGATSGAVMFGSNNQERLRAGKPPVRRNPRTGRTETMRLPAGGNTDNDGRAPAPAWPGTELDPFAPNG